MRVKYHHETLDFEPCALTFVLVCQKYAPRLLGMGTVVARKAKKLCEWTFSFLTFTMNFFKTSISVSHCFQIWSQFGYMKGCKSCLKLLILLLSLTAELRHQSDSAALLSKHWMLLESQLGRFRDFKHREMIKYKAQFGKCTLQNYKFKIYLHKTESSVIEN